MLAAYFLKCPSPASEPDFLDGFHPTALEVAGFEQPASGQAPLAHRGLQWPTCAKER